MLMIANTSAGLPLALVAWTIWSVLALVAGVAALAWAQGAVYHRRRRRSWPDGLAVLTADLPRWPGLRPAAGVIGLLALVLAFCTAGSFPPILATFVAAVTCLGLAHRRWSTVLAVLGLLLLTTAAFLVLPAVLAWRIGQFPQGTAAAGLVGLAFATWLWQWLAVVWRQQLDNGRAWTTAGRLIPAARAVGGATAVAGAVLALCVLLHLLLGEAGAQQAGIRWAGAVGTLALSAAAAWSARAGGGRWLRGLGVFFLIVFHGFVLGPWLLSR